MLLFFSFLFFFLFCSEEVYLYVYNFNMLYYTCCIKCCTCAAGIASVGVIVEAIIGLILILQHRERGSSRRVFLSCDRMEGSNNTCLHVLVVSLCYHNTICVIDSQRTGRTRHDYTSPITQYSTPFPQTSSTMPAHTYTPTAMHTEQYIASTLWPLVLTQGWR